MDVYHLCEPCGILVAFWSGLLKSDTARQEIGLPVSEHGRGDLMSTAAFRTALSPPEQLPHALSFALGSDLATVYLGNPPSSDLLDCR